VIFLALDDVLHVAERTLGKPPQVRDIVPNERCRSRADACEAVRVGIPRLMGLRAASLA